MEGSAPALRTILDMPIEIMEEILSYCHPSGILGLSWTCRTIHGFLMQQSSAPYWKQSVKQWISWGPACPDQLIEPAWFALNFSSTCTGCGKSTSTTVLWTHFVQLCKSCKPVFLMDQRELWNNSGFCHILGSDPQAYRSYGLTYHLRSEVDQVLRTWRESSVLDELSRARGEHPGSEAEARENRARLAPCNDPRWSCTIYSSGSCSPWTDENCEDSHEQRLLHYAQVQEDQKLHNNLKSLQFALSSKRVLRWTPELLLTRDREQCISKHPLVHLPDPLLDRYWWASKDAWNKHIQAAQEARLAHELRLRLCGRLDSFLSVGLRLLHQYLRQNPELRAYGLNAADLALTPEVREIMHRPDNAQVDMGSFAFLEENMGAIIDAWRTRILNNLREAIPERTDRGTTVDLLDLATTMWTCRRCNEAFLRFPSVLTHECQRPGSIEWDQDVWADIVRRRNGLRGRLADPDIGFALSLALWPCEYSEPAHQIVRLCGMDPGVATAREMDAIDVRLVRGNAIMTWRAAIIEQTRHNCGLSDWRVADCEELTKTRTRETQIIQSEHRWTCTRCSWSGRRSRLLVEQHITDVHKITEPLVEGEDMVAIVPPDSACANGVFKFSLPGYELLRDLVALR